MGTEHGDHWLDVLAEDPIDDFDQLVFSRIPGARRPDDDEDDELPEGVKVVTSP